MTAVFRSAMNTLKLRVFVTTSIMASLSSFSLPYWAGENVSEFAFCATVAFYLLLFIYLSTILDENETSNSIYITEAWFRFQTGAPDVLWRKSRTEEGFPSTPFIFHCQCHASNAP
jgi:hypothetical protein